MSLDAAAITACAHQLADLDRGDADRAAGTEDEQRLALAEGGAVLQSVQGRSVRVVESGRNVEGDRTRADVAPVAARIAVNSAQPPVAPSAPSTRSPIDQPAT